MSITIHPPVGYLAPYLNDGQLKGFKVGDKVEFSPSRGGARVGEVVELIGRAGRCKVRRLDTDTVYEIWPKRPTTIGEMKARLTRARKRDERGRFTR